MYGSLPVPGAEALKYRLPSIETKPCGSESALPGAMSLARLTEDPVVLKSSRPWVASSAEK
jgi:hypothetical protein